MVLFVYDLISSETKNGKFPYDIEVRRREKLEALDRVTGIPGLVTVVDPSSGTISEFPKKLHP